MKRWRLAMVFSAPVFLLLLTPILFLSSGQVQATACGTSGAVMVSPLGIDLNSSDILIAGVPMTAEQKTNAQTIIGVAEARGLDNRDTLIVLMIGLQETKLTNPSYGTGDSLGIFQQSPSNGWGTRQEIADVAYAANALIDHLLSIPNREQMSLLDVALAVQKPDPAAYLSPANYFPSWQATAQQILDAASPPSGTPPKQTPSYQQVCAYTGPADGKVETAVQYALSVIGTPYVWGGETETGGFDCSGLVWWAFSQAGFPFGRTSAAGEYSWGVPISLDQLQRGDLVFWAYDPSDPGTIHHVAIYIGDGDIVAAPHTGDVVKIEPLYDTDHALAVRVTPSKETSQ